MAFTVSFAEVHGWPRAKWEAGQFTAERRVQVYWEDQYQFLAELNQYPNYLYPYSNGPADATARAIEILPMGKSTASGSYASYQWAIMRIIHTTKGPRYSQLQKWSLNEQLVPSYQTSAVDTTGMTWTSGGVAVAANEAPWLDAVEYDYIVTVAEAPRVPPFVMASPNIINWDAVPTSFLGVTFPPRTLRYCGADVRVSYSMGTTAKYTTVLRYKYKHSEWNKYWRAKTQAWETMSINGSVYYQYPETPWAGVL